MTLRSSFVRKSYIKTAAACLLVTLVALGVAAVGLRWLPALLSVVVAVLGVLVALVAAVLTIASAVVLIRHKRVASCDHDLFLELNRSREPDAINSAAAPRPTRMRRWLARRLLGHDLVVGDWVEIKSWEEIRETLDEQGHHEQLPFMPEMLAMCGQRTRVFRCVHRLFDYRKTRRMRHMDGGVLLTGVVCDGSSHGGCEAACHTIWKAAWLRRVDGGEAASRSPRAHDRSAEVQASAILQIGVHPPRYACQLTQLHAASRPIGKASLINFIRPLVAGNVTPAAFTVGWLTHLFNELQHLRQGVSFPTFEEGGQAGETPDEDIRLQPGDQVVVRLSGEIRATLNDQSLHRGLYFEPDMLKHCGRRYCVQAKVGRLIDIVTGEMRTMKTPAYVLRDIHFSGERQLFNAQYEPLFWRHAWLQRDAR